MKLQENEKIELKREMVQDLDKEIVAFLNSHGGSIYISIDDEGNIIGVNNQALRDEYSLIVGNIITDGITPSCRNDISFYFNKTNILVIKIKEGNKKPYYLSSKGPRPSGVYLRVGASKRPANDEEILAMIMESRKVSYEKEISEIQNLNFDYVANIAKRKEIDFDDRAFLSLGIKDKNGKFTKLGLLLSEENQIIIKFASYDQNLNFKIKKEFEGSIIKIADQLLDYSELLNTTSAIIVPYQAQRIETKSFPGVSLREALLNAICHANYMKASNIKIEFYDDRVEITSPGGIYDGTLTQILKGYQTFRNPGLVRVLAKFEYIENYGKGLKRINEAYKSKKKKPTFIANDTFFRVILPDLNYENKKNEISKIKNEEINKGTKDLEVELILLVVSNPSITIPEMAKITRKSHGTIERVIKNSKKIIRVGSKRNGQWKVLKSEN